MSRETDLAWAAGFYEGEGTCALRRNSYRRRYLHLKVVNTDESTVRRFHEIVGFGSVGGPYGSKTRTGEPAQPQWFWQGTGHDAKAFLLGTRTHFYDLLSGRRRSKIDEVMALQDANPPKARRIADDPVTGTRRFSRVVA